MKALTNITALLLFVLSASAVQASSLDEKLNGTWLYEALQAPYEYQKGQILFYEEEGETKVKIVTDQGTITANNLKIENDEVAFDFYVENDYCKATLKYKEDILSGKVATGQGDIPVTMKRKQ